jgi:hypothetical protein
MAKLVTLEVTRTYATRENAIKAFEKLFGDAPIRYLVMQHTDGRFFPVALDPNTALQYGVHFHFHVVG